VQLEAAMGGLWGRSAFGRRWWTKSPKHLYQSRGVRVIAATPGLAALGSSSCLTPQPWNFIGIM